MILILIYFKLLLIPCKVHPKEKKNFTKPYEENRKNHFYFMLYEMFSDHEEFSKKKKRRSMWQKGWLTPKKKKCSKNSKVTKTCIKLSCF